MSTEDNILDKLWDEYRNSETDAGDDPPRVYDEYYAGWLEDKYVQLVQDLDRLLQKYQTIT